MRRYTPDEFRAAFWKRVAPSPGCWIWSGSRIHHGYGRVKRDRRLELAHRVAWELVNGPVPEGSCVLHRCDNPPCCRPDHLFIGDQFANMDDRRVKGRGAHRRGSAHQNSKLTEADVLAARASVAAGTATIAELARQHAVTWTAVGLAVKGKSWRHL